MFRTWIQHEFSGHSSIKCPFDTTKEFCLADKKEITCEDGGYVDSVPSGKICNGVFYEGKSCYKDCVTVTCALGGYQSSIPSGQTCTSVSYYGKTCYTSCYTPSNTTKSSCSNEYGYYKNRSCSEFSAYQTGQQCHARYNELGNQCYHNGAVGEGTGACDVDSWHRCCLECNGD
ncbi:MAG: hypothetical protein ACK5N8_02495 [Alphaproteobacteria bacterium]